MSRLSRRAAAARLREINAQLDDDELRVVTAMVGMKVGLLTTAKTLRLRKAEVVALLRRGLEKVSSWYAQHDAQAARAAGSVH